MKERIDELVAIYTHGKYVSGRPDLRYAIIHRKAKRHGHLAVYRVSAGAVEVLHIFHTAQNWQTKLAEENPSS